MRAVQKMNYGNQSGYWRGDGRRDQEGFSVIELMIAVAIGLVLAALAIPGYQAMNRYLRLSGDMRGITGVVAQAKMRAAADFTHARAYADLGANTFHLEVWNKNGNGGAGCWQADGDKNQCTVTGTSPALPLSQGVTFGTSGVGAGGANPATTITQAAACDNGTGGQIASTACIVFNSRGIPINAAGAPLTGVQAAFYVTDTKSVWGVTVRGTGAIQVWATDVQKQNWTHR